MKRPKSMLNFVFLVFVACLIFSCELTGSGQFTTTDPWLPTITFNEQETVIQSGSSMTITASVNPDPDSYAWYLDGDLIVGATTATVTLGSDVDLGSHIVTLVVVKGNYRSSGSFSFEVSSGTPTVTVDPNAVTNGTVGQSYSFTVTADNIPSGVSQVTFNYSFGDGSVTGTGSQPATVSNHSASITISHTYDAASAYGLTVAVSDGSTTLATGYASVIIGQVNPGNDYDLTVLDDWIAANSGGYGITVDTWDISQLPTGCVFDMQFDAYSIPDKFIVEYPDGHTAKDTGWRGDSYYEGPLYPGGIAGTGAGQIDSMFTKGSQQHFKITVIGPDTGTAWEYSIRARMP
ncbi:MAG: hypothetical protein BWX81_01537 [Spirochaetes bacterium ADurb.Bin110]|nr:MAG: hypothetical protein BWX81_01537 [Spirochaetes bacterium ADurb.Bin110]